LREFNKEEIRRPSGRGDGQKGRKGGREEREKTARGGERGRKGVRIAVPLGLFIGGVMTW